MPKSNYGEYANIPQTRHVNASDFFHNLREKAKKIAQDESEKMANSMVFALKHRQHLKGGYGQSPKFNPSRFKYSVKRPQSKKSYLNWAVKPRPNGEYWISNDSEADNGYNYMKPILTGSGWSSKVQGGVFRRLVRNGGLIFSDQLPQGINPWLNLKRDELETNIKTKFREGLHK